MQLLKEQFAAIRSQGYALNQEEEMDGIAGVAAPIFNLTGDVVGSIGVGINPRPTATSADCRRPLPAFAHQRASRVNT